MAASVSLKDSTSYMNTDNASLLEGSTEISMCFWLNWTNIPGVVATILGRWGSGVDSFYMYKEYNHYLTIRLDTPTGNFRTTNKLATMGVSIDEWHHYCFTWKATTDINFYLDGVEQSISVYSGSTSYIYNSTHKYAIGRITGIYSCQGLFSNIILYDKKISISELQEIIHNPESLNGNMKSKIQCFGENLDKDMVTSEAVTYSNTEDSSDAPPFFFY